MYLYCEEFRILIVRELGIRLRELALNLVHIENSSNYSSVQYELRLGVRVYSVMLASICDKLEIYRYLRVFATYSVCKSLLYRGMLCGIAWHSIYTRTLPSNTSKYTVHLVILYGVR